jgi:hypothetical protein
MDKFFKNITYNKNNYDTILDLGNKYKNKKINILLVKKLLIEIDKKFYNNKLFKYLKNMIGKKYKLNIINSTLHDCYGEISFENYKFNLYLSLDRIINNKKNMNNDEYFFSGGYITKNSIIFLILILLHETLHMIEFLDTLYANIEYHCVNFYKYGYKLFGMSSIYSDLITINDINNKDSYDIIKYEMQLQKCRKKILNGSDKLKDYYDYYNKDGSLEVFKYKVQKII